MAKNSKATQQQQANRNKIILERLMEEHPERTRPTASQQSPSDADEQPDLSVAGSTAKPKIRSKDLTGLKYFDKLAPLLVSPDDAYQLRPSSLTGEFRTDLYFIFLLFVSTNFRLHSFSSDRSSLSSPSLPFSMEGTSSSCTYSSDFSIVPSALS